MAFEYLHRAVEMARWSGAGALESFALHDFARLGKAAEVVEPLRDLGPGDRGAIWYGQSAARRSGCHPRRVELEASSSEFEHMGAVLVAAEAAADAAAIRRRQGDLRQATALERRSSALAIRCEGATSPTLATNAPARAILSARELEIAGLAASGMPNKEIAQRLFLSHRTIENKLRSAYMKLGVNNRSELSEVLRSL